MEYNLNELVASMWEHREKKDFGRKDLETTYRGLFVKASIGMTGNISKIPWISYCAEGQETQKGIYPVLLFYGTPEFVRKNKNKEEVRKIVLAYGISARNKPDVLWGSEVEGKITINDAFKEWNYDTSDSGIKKYNSSYVYKIYDWTDNVNYTLIQEDIDKLINTYVSMLGCEDKKIDTTDDSQNKEFIPIQKIYFGTPGGGKSHKVKTLIEDTKKAKDRYFRTTFHPDTDYASFVGSYKPIMKGELICYEYVPQVFTLAYIAAWNDPDKEYFLDIEEINRGNCAQIFGDLFQLLDRNKKGYSEFPVQADSDLANYLLYAKDKDGNDILSNKDGIEKKKLCLPPNLSIVATMNTSDQSLFPMDSAFKRRWDWEFVPSTFNEKDNFNISLGNKVYKWHTFLKEANARIKQATDSEDKQMGAYFVKTDMDEEKFKSKVMYYLWSEICKEEYKTQNNFFRYIDQDNNEQEFTFNELYDDGSTMMLQKFMKFMNVSPVNGGNPDEEDKQENEE
jgi:hypothetical protein